MKSPYLPAVITRPISQAAKVDRLVKHCRNLDGTELVVIDDPDTSNPGRGTPELAQCAINSLHLACAAMKGRPFIWLETDSIPVQEGWRAAISAEYRKIGKPFLLPDMSSCDKHDIASGIGVYPGESHFILPKSYQKHGWDYWMEMHLQEVIGRTKLIQHRYGKYFDGHATPWEFPRDKFILNPEAVIFHKDRNQFLIDCFSDSPYQLDFSKAPVHLPNTPRMRHCGDIGDLIAALPILRATGGGEIVLFHDESAPKGMAARESLKGKRFDAIKPLLEAQPYVYGVSWSDNISVKENGFREVRRPQNESLSERQARHSGNWPIDLSPWLRVPDVIEEHKRIICCRSPRYHADFEFPWKDAAETYGDRLLFIGLPEEHAAFEGLLGRRVEHAKTENFLDIARIMAGAPQVIANQSSPLWVALGLGKKVIVEGWGHAPNTEIKRPGSFWAYTAKDMATVRQAFAAVRARK